jgi:hypothetical protein
MKTSTLVALMYTTTALFIVGSLAQLFISVVHADVAGSWSLASLQISVLDGL